MSGSSVYSQFRLLESETFAREHLRRGVRTDGRLLTDARSTSLQLGVSKGAEGSALYKQGPTTVLASLHGRVGSPDILRAPGQGRLAFVVQTQSLSDAVQSEAKEVEAVLNEMAARGLLLSLEGLCLKAGLYCWDLEVRLVLAEVDGALLDASFGAAVAVLADGRLPEAKFPDEVSLDSEAKASTALRRAKLRPTFHLDQTKPLPILHTPFALSFSLFKETKEDGSLSTELVVDPSAEELSMLKTGLVCLIQLNGEGKMGGVHHFGGWDGDLLSAEVLAKAREATQRRHQQLSKLLDQAKHISS